jgi:(S)-mandelate dehydrogenase
VAAIDRCYNIEDLRAVSRRRLPKWVFEFVDRGSEDEWAIAHNREAFRRLKLRNRALVDIAQRDVGTTLFGKKVALPLAIAPTGSAGLLWYEGDVALAKAAAKIGVPFTAAVSSLTSLEKIAEQAGGARWFQTYLWKDQALLENLLTRAERAGYETLIVTVDIGIGTNREFNYRNGQINPFRPSYPTVRDILLRPRWMTQVLFRYLASTGMPKQQNIGPEFTNAADPLRTRDAAVTWDDFARLRDRWSGKLIIKGVVRASDAERAVSCGADGVVVSNHGGRNMDSAVASIDALPEVVKAVGARTTVLLDSGIRRGSDIVKALALGAKAVLIGRATLFGIAAGGQAGAAHALKLLCHEYEQTLAYVGCRSAHDLDRDVLASDQPLRGHTL